MRAGFTVIVVVRVTPNHVAVMVAVVVAVTADVVTANVPVDEPPLTTVSDGTWTTAGLLLESWTDGAVRRAGEGDRARGRAAAGQDRRGRRDGRERRALGGVAALTERFAVRGTFWIAAMSWTIVAGAAAFVATVNVTVPTPAGATTVAGTSPPTGRC